MQTVFVEILLVIRGLSISLLGRTHQGIQIQTWTEAACTYWPLFSSYYPVETRRVCPLWVVVNGKAFNIICLSRALGLRFPSTGLWEVDVCAVWFTPSGCYRAGWQWRDASSMWIVLDKAIAIVLFSPFSHYCLCCLPLVSFSVVIAGLFPLCGLS